MKNNYFKIIIPCISKNYFNFVKGENNKYKGNECYINYWKENKKNSF